MAVKTVSMPKSSEYATGLMRFSLARLARSKAIVKKGKNPAKKVVKAKRTVKAQKLNSKITPGTILVILAGRYAGKRVVFLKQLPKSGLLLVTGPFSINSVPVRRIAQKFVLPTSTKIDVSGVKIPANMDDAYFKRTKAFGKEKKDIFEQGKQEYTLTEARKADQKTIDTAILASIKKHADAKLLTGYLRTCFGLAKRQYPHKMVF
uniref:Large ribosomal subunit protein eL6 n=1 Tax=Parastrongyloides trichosuri TaxID=131310 RepID=A0A0N4ZYI5_PARTI